MKQAIFKSIYHLLRVTKWCTIIPIGLLIGRIRSRRQIVRVWPEKSVILGSRVAIFAHFDRRGVVRPQLLDYVRELAQNGRDVVFVTNSRDIQSNARVALQEFCKYVVVRRNVGRDFGAWRDVLELLNLPRAETQELIFVNDTMFGPLLPLDTMLSRLDYDKADVWGLTENWQVRYHLQSFFLAFGPRAIHAEAFRKFWQSVRPVPVKSYVRRQYEIGITHIMMQGGLKCSALWGYEALVKRVSLEALEKLFVEDEMESGKTDPILDTRKLQAIRIRSSLAKRLALNPIFDLWRQLLVSGFPFINCELLRDNPTKVEDIGDWADVMREDLGVDPSPTLLVLRTTLRNSAP
jgi:Rhamnan synthesis protein F